MRVIAGTARGRRLQGPRDKSGKTRPSSDLVKGAIFDSLAAMGASLESVLDLYAGSGGLGIEALSRGADRCDFVERDAAACAVLRENLKSTGFDEGARVLKLPVERALSRLQGPYTLVLADPPYNEPEALEALASLAASALVRSGDTILVLEHSSRVEPGGQIGLFSLVKVRRHGDSAVSIYR